MKNIMSILIFAFILCSLDAFAEGEVYYSVPVENIKLEPYATFQLNAPQIIKEGNKTTLIYSLPKELVGKNFPPIAISGEDYGAEVFALAGPNAQAECQKLDQKTLCKIIYSNLELDKAAISKAIRETSKSLKEARLRERVANIFKGDPVGILTY